MRPSPLAGPGDRAISLVPWEPADWPLLAGLEGPQRGEPTFKVREAASGRPAGMIGLWPRYWRAQMVFELAWSILPAFADRGVTRPAVVEVLAHARADGRRRFVHAFPAADAAEANALCKELGFAAVGTCDFEDAAGALTRHVDWRLDLTA